MNSNTSDNMPEYLKEQYVENFLKIYFKDSSLKVLNIVAKPAIAKGESFCSIMTRVKVTYKMDVGKDSKDIQFLIKSTYNNNPYLAGVLREYDIYNTEMQLYENVFPKLQQMLYDIGDKDQLCAKTIHVDYKRELMVIEDLALRKFFTPNRLNGMNEDHVKFSLKKLATMHATAAVFNERHNGALEKYTRGIFNRHVNRYGLFFECVIKVCAKFAESCPELGIYYRDKLLKLVPYCVEYATRCYDPKPDHFLTLNHGDLWTNNVMAQYTDEKEKTKVNDVLLIDFQYCNWTSPAVDIHYFFSTSLDDDLCLNGQPKLIQYYHQVLSETLEKLGYKKHIPSLHELNVQLLERGFYGKFYFIIEFTQNIFK